MSKNNDESTSGAATNKSPDMKFMMTAAQGGVSEVEMARLALQRSSSDFVKQYAQRMIDDHTKANDELMQVASAKGITLPTAPDAKHQAAMARLQQLSGAEFDRMYIKMAGINDHMKMQKLFQKESTAGKDAEAKAFAAKTLPAVQEHRRMAQEMSNSMMGGMKTSKDTKGGTTNTP